MGLIAAEIERRGIPTVAIQLLEVVARRVRPPRGLLVPFRHGYPLGRPRDPDAQRAVLEAALALLGGPASRGPVLATYAPPTLPGAEPEEP